MTLFDLRATPPTLCVSFPTPLRHRHGPPARRLIGRRLNRHRLSGPTSKPALSDWSPSNPARVPSRQVLADPAGSSRSCSTSDRRSQRTLRRRSAATPAPSANETGCPAHHSCTRPRSFSTRGRSGLAVSCWGASASRAVSSSGPTSTRCRGSHVHNAVCQVEDVGPKEPPSRKSTGPSASPTRTSESNSSSA